jgi:Uma2 family endonuclease
MGTLTQITADDLERIAPYVGPCELVAGELVRMSPGGAEHSAVTGQIFLLLQAHARQMAAGRVLTNETGIVVKRHPDTVRGADVLFISYSRLPKDTALKGYLRHPPEIVVEVLSDDDTWKRMEEKIGDYHGCGVDMVWVADPRTLSVRIYPNGGDVTVRHASEQINGDPFLPGFRCTVSDIFAI